MDGGPGDDALGGSDASDHADTNRGDVGGGGSRDGGAPTGADVKPWIEAYKAAHPGNGGKDWDINAKTPAEVAADPDAQRLVVLCGDDQRPVIPLLAWEHGGLDHQGRDQVLACLGDPSNIEILVDTAGLNDGADAGLSLANARTDLYLIQADGTRVFLYAGL